MAALLDKVDPGTVGLCLATAIFGVAVGWIWNSRSTGKNCCNKTIKKDCGKVCLGLVS